MSDIIPGLKIIYQTGDVNLPDDTSMPYRLDANFRPPEFMQVAFVFMHGGSEEIVVRSETRQALDQFIKTNSLETNPRIRQLTITGPSGIEYQFPKKQ